MRQGIGSRSFIRDRFEEGYGTCPGEVMFAFHL